MYNKTKKIILNYKTGFMSGLYTLSPFEGLFCEAEKGAGPALWAPLALGAFWMGYAVVAITKDAISGYFQPGYRIPARPQVTEEEALALTSRVNGLVIQGKRTEAAKLIRQAHSKNPHDTIERLKYLCSTEERDQFYQAAKNRSKCFTTKCVTDGLWGLKDGRFWHPQALLIQAHVIRKIYDDCITVQSAQSRNWQILTYLLKEFMRRQSPKGQGINFKPTRGTASVVNPEPTLETYSSAEKVCDTEEPARSHLISGDIYPYRNNEKDSAIHFLYSNENILNDEEAISKIIYKEIQTQYPSMPASTVKKYADRLIKISQLFRMAPCGNLFTISIPRNQFDTTAYLAHSFGTPCRCLKSRELWHQVIESNALRANQLQKGITDKTTKCEYPGPLYSPSPQVRVFTPKLRVGEGIHIHLLTPMPRDQRKRYKSQIREIVDEMEAWSQ